MRSPLSARLAPAASAALVIMLSACTDGNTEPTPGPDFFRYGAIGKSVSMGWADDGVHAVSQGSSWPRQLAAAAGVPFTQPLLTMPGCQPPPASPLASFGRIDNSSVAAKETTCSANAGNVQPPASNLAIEGALATDALNETRENAVRPVVSRVLPPGKTQVTAMRSLAPSFVSVDLGGNEVLPVQVGVLAPA